jgi:hypothetical protein
MAQLASKLRIRPSEDCADVFVGGRFMCSAWIRFYDIDGGMLMLFIACLCVAMWGSISVFIEVAKRRPREPLNSLRNRYEVDDYIWGNAASLPLRRRYVLCSACAPLALLCMARLVWVNEDDPGRRLIGIVLPGLFALIITATLIRKVMRHGL